MKDALQLVGSLICLFSVLVVFHLGGYIFRILVVVALGIIIIALGKIIGLLKPPDSKE